MIKIVLTFVAGTVVGVGGKMLYDHWRNPPVGGAPIAGAKLHGKIVPGPVGAPSLGVPQAGFATTPLYEWAYSIGEGDTAGGIAEAVTGHDVRYQELLLANPALPTVGEAGIYAGDHAWDFAPGAFRAGVHLLMPIAWNPYIDQTGAPRGRAVPYPDDPRALIASPPPGPALPAPPPPLTSSATDGLAEGAKPALAGSASGASGASTAGTAPYDRPFLQPGRAA